MTLLQRFGWGIVAGFAIVCVKFLGPDAEYVQQIISDLNIGHVTFYVIFSLVTVFLGGISGLFSQDREPLRILVFCAAFPATVSAALPGSGKPPVSKTENGSAADLAGRTEFPLSLIVTSALAEDATDGVCNEGGFTAQFTQAAREYFSGPVVQDTYSVIVGSATELAEAQRLADEFARRSEGLSVTVGCRRPGNPYYPIVVGEVSDLETAAEIKGRVIGEGWAREDSYLSDYPFRKPIYQAE
ncbi:hypothetical protein E2A64_16765 [Pseudohoeflea suaedae]|uniref:SPOR domain-containing protein n=1 Tax=Pseudohoeflea suaedae TaxID=877384 RepID=A0A4R5PIH5_9HYPH|nr:hypothetical protein [Pseudohoeflea suaedae]TDH34321.1 hypothetical protein E2A64_16765 [Pseudohoeflea suaedae]